MENSKNNDEESESNNKEIYKKNKNDKIIEKNNRNNTITENTKFSFLPEIKKNEEKNKIEKNLNEKYFKLREILENERNHEEDLICKPLKREKKIEYENILNDYKKDYIKAEFEKKKKRNIK